MRSHIIKRLTFLNVVACLLALASTTLDNSAVAWAETKKEELPERVVLENFPAYGQRYNLSCEYAATHAVTRYYQRPITEEDFIQTIGFDPNPHIGFRGNINGPFGGTWDYGIYAEPMARVLEARGWKTKLLVNKEISLKQELALGRPVQVWVIAGFGWGSPFTAVYKEQPFKLAGGEHSVVAYGYDAQGVYIMDVAYGGFTYVNWSAFLRSWSYFDYMAMSFWPGDQRNGPEATPGVAHQFYRHWMNAGGLAVIGQPISEATTENGKLVQYFERARLEFDPNGPLTQPITHGLLGREITRGRESELPFQSISKPGDMSLLYFDETRHTLGQGFRAHWEQNGGMAAFGFPISEEFKEGDKLVQYFERARFEYFPNNLEPYNIMIGLLGNDRLKQGVMARKR